MKPERRAAALLPALLAGVGVLALLALGTWQLERSAWKTALIAELTARGQLAPVTLPASIDDVAPWEWRTVTVAGFFAHDRELYWQRASRDGRAGVHVLTPLLRADGAPVLVDRGWVPPELVDPARRAEGLVTGSMTIQGVARLPTAPGWFTPANDAAANAWYSIDLTAMAAQAGVPALAPVIVVADAGAVPGGWPQGGQAVLELRNDHLGYALTWYALAVALAAIYIAFRRRDGRRPPR